ncbi:hypothetical protein AwDysgo_09870 [Bacteroidales bacterium]|nr:hypothetical protein AwDysgo_09870 [Bacteroidales bacterium]
MKHTILFLLVSLLAVSCGKQIGQKDGVVIVKVGDNTLTKERLEAEMPPSLSAEDSLIYAEKIIRSWIGDILMYDLASQNMSNKQEVENLLEEYRKSLVVYQYQAHLINEKLSKEINEEEMLRYFEANEDRFKLDQVLVTGLFLKIPIDAPQVSSVREWYKSSAPAALEKIEKYSIQNAVVYEYFYDNWVDYNEIADNLPFYDNTKKVSRNMHIELKDSDFHYFVNIKDCLQIGDNAPYDYAKASIKEIIINQRKKDFLKNVEDDLYQTALGNGQIIFKDK